MTGGALLTIGHGTRELDDFIALLREHDVQVVTDVRTSPYSAYTPAYNKEALQAALRSAGIVYVFMGDSLGGRPEGEEYYTDGHADYTKMATRPAFLAGLDRLESGLTQNYRIALLCSEARPEICHRTRLVARSMTARGRVVMHIDEAGRLVDHEQVMARITGGQAELFGEASLPLASPKRIRRR